jgi:hypothetical protein
MNDMTRQDLMAKLIAKAWKDDAFRQKLLSNPKATVEQELGEALPGTLDIKIVEEPQNTLYIVLPAKPMLSGELTDDELTEVAGGLSLACKSNASGNTATATSAGCYTSNCRPGIGTSDCN